MSGLLKDTSEIEDYSLKAKYLRENGYETWYHNDNWIYSNYSGDHSRSGRSTDDLYYELTYIDNKVINDDKIIVEHKSYQVHIDINGNIKKCYITVNYSNSDIDRDWFDDDYENNEIHLISNMVVKDEVSAITIANERRLKHITNNTWGKILR